GTGRRRAETARPPTPPKVAAAPAAVAARLRRLPDVPHRSESATGSRAAAGAVHRRRRDATRGARREVPAAPGGDREAVAGVAPRPARGVAPALRGRARPLSDDVARP